MNAPVPRSAVPAPTPENGTERSTRSGNVPNDGNASDSAQTLSVSFEEFCRRDLPPPTWLVDQLIPDEGLVLAVGETGVGKTWFSLFAADQVAAKGHSVLFVELEGSASGFQDRLKKLGLESSRCHLIHGRSFDLLKPASLLPLQSEIRRLQPRLIVFDCFVEAFSGVENDAGDVTRALKALKALQCETTIKAALLMLHHTGKPGADGPRGTYSARGSSAFDGAADAVLRLTKEPSDDNRPQLGVTMTKAREFPTSPPMKLRVLFDQAPTFEVRAREQGNTDPRIARTIESIDDVQPGEIESLMQVLPMKSRAEVGKALGRQRKAAGLILDAAIKRGRVTYSRTLGYMAVVASSPGEQLI